MFFYFSLKVSDIHSYSSFFFRLSLREPISISDIIILIPAFQYSFFSFFSSVQFTVVMNLGVRNFWSDVSPFVLFWALRGIVISLVAPRSYRFFHKVIASGSVSTSNFK